MIKSPWSHEFLREVLSDGRVALDALVIPMRQLRAATASRVVVELSHKYRHAPDQLLSDTTLHSAPVCEIGGGHVFDR